MKRKKQIIAIICSMLFLSSICIGCIIYLNNKSEVKTIKSEKELLKIYNNDSYDWEDNPIFELMVLPGRIVYSSFDIAYSLFHYHNRGYNYRDYDILESDSNTNLWRSTGNGNSSDIFSLPEPSSTSVSDSNSKISLSTSKDYSTTNIQVENVDEADITKTDGNFIYSISENNVIITNVENPNDIKIEAKISNNSYGGTPEDLILYKNELIVISSKNQNSRSKSEENTIVNVYNIENKKIPKLVKNYELHEPYYTSRCINNKLYVISCGYLRNDDKEIDREYKEDKKTKEIPLKNIKYLKDVKTKKQTLISVVDLDNVKESLKLDSYLIDISNAYVSENNIYLLDEKYNNDSEISSYAKKIFGLKGIFGIFSEEDDEFYANKTEIYKFKISKDGNVEYDAKNKVKGKTINQYSLDEKEGHLRIAVYDRDGARVVIFNEGLKEIGKTDYVAKGETMYSSRFMGDKAYLVTYKVTDPLFVIDLSDEKNPEILGELHIPGYSTYLHPYDENHLIGIGMQTEETVRKDKDGKVLSTSSRITGMKMALFDVSDVENPTQISEVTIGDRRTTSAILTNPKALLFSKEKELIAIPVNNYNEDFEIGSNNETYSSTVNSYKNYNKSYISEGYLVYNLNLDEGFKLKGSITHEKNESTSNNKTSYTNTSTKLLRGLYIENDLYTISEDQIKVNKLENLDLISELKIR